MRCLIDVHGKRSAAIAVGVMLLVVAFAQSPSWTAEIAAEHEQSTHLRQTRTDDKKKRGEGRRGRAGGRTGDKESNKAKGRLQRAGDGQSAQEADDDHRHALGRRRVKQRHRLREELHLRLVVQP